MIHKYSAKLRGVRQVVVKGSHKIKGSQEKYNIIA